MILLICGLRQLQANNVNQRSVHKQFTLKNSRSNQLNIIEGPCLLLYSVVPDICALL